MSSGGGQQQTTMEFKPPEWTQQNWQNAVAASANLANTPYAQYGGQTIADFNPDQRAAQDMVYQSATLGAPDVNTGRGAFTNVAAGNYLNSNPWTSPDYTSAVIGDNATQMANAAAIGQNAQTDAMFARSGAYGGSAYQDAQARNATALDTSVGQMANQYRLQNANLGANDYRSGVGQMLQGAQGAEQGQALDLNAANALNNMGTAKQNYTNQLLQQLYGEYQTQMNYPNSQLQNWMNQLTQASGGQGSQVQTSPGQSPWAGLLGGGLAAAGAYNLFKPS